MENNDIHNMNLNGILDTFQMYRKTYKNKFFNSTSEICLTFTIINN